jgi:hypothetical protein
MLPFWLLLTSHLLFLRPCEFSTSQDGTIISKKSCRAIISAFIRARLTIYDPQCSPVSTFFGIDIKIDPRWPFIAALLRAISGLEKIYEEKFTMVYRNRFILSLFTNSRGVIQGPKEPEGVGIFTKRAIVNLPKWLVELLVSPKKIMINSKLVDEQFISRLFYHSGCK